MLSLTVEFTDVYDGEEYVRTEDVYAPAPTAGDDLDEWAEENLFPLTGTGREHGEAAYFVKVLSAPCLDPNVPDLTGKTWEWGDL